MTVVSNASPLISLAKVGCLNLLPEIFGQILITPEVHKEVVGAGPNRPGAEAIARASWIQIRAVTDSDQLQRWKQTKRLGTGELATILLAAEIGADVALVDERAARLLAAQQGVRVLGCIGILESGYRRGRVADIRAVYALLLAEGAYIDRRILDRSLAGFDLPPL